MSPTPCEVVTMVKGAFESCLEILLSALEILDCTPFNLKSFSILSLFRNYLKALNRIPQEALLWDSL